MQSAALHSIMPNAVNSVRPVEDRRRHPRYAMSFAITMFTDNNFYAGFTEDISEGGVFIATYRILEIGTIVTLSLYLEENEAPYEITGTVQWTRGPEAMGDGKSVFGMDRSPVKTGVGIRFDDISAEAIAAIRKFMEGRQPEFYA